MKKAMFVLSCVLTLSMLAAAAHAQGSGSGSGQASGRGDAQAAVATTQDNKALVEKMRELEAAKARLDAQMNPKFVRTLTNVQVELTITDQMGTQTPEKKTVSMIVSSGNWGKIRSAGSVRPPTEPPYGVEVNVDARPFVSVEGQIQLELTINYAPPSADKESSRVRPTGINQSQTLILQSGKPMVISQAADPVSDRKVTIEARATVLK